MSDFLVLTQPLLCSLQISIFIYPSGTPHSVQKELKSEKVEQTKVMQTQDWLCIHIQARTFFPHLLPPISTSNSEPLTPSLTLQLTMNKRYVVSQQALNIQRVHFGPGMSPSVILGQVRAEEPVWEGALRMLTWGGVGAGAVPAGPLSAF